VKIGMMVSDLSSDTLNFLKAIGVDHICALDHHAFGYDGQGYWDPEPIREMRRHVERHGVRVDMLALPLPPASVDQAEMPNIMLGTPRRDQEIDRVIRCIRAAAKAGIPAVKGNLIVTGLLRTKPVAGRGGALHTAFDLAELQVPATGAGTVSADQAWERIAHFVERVIPAAEDAGVRVAIHPHDPAVPHGIGLDDRVLGDIAGLRRFCNLSSSPSHGLHFCQGCMQASGASHEELLAAIHEFGAQKKLFLVHFRTVKGGLGKFREAFIDEGDWDLIALLRAYHETGYEHMIVPDHYPRMSGDTAWGHQSRAYATGYIKALMVAAGARRERAGL
jgi:mannonate dehydratase